MRYGRYHLRPMRYVRDNRLGYWLVGTTLMWFALPANLFDMMVAGEWTAPNPDCDSFAIPAVEALTLALPWAIFATCVAAVAVFLLVGRRVGGADIFDFRLGTGWRRWLISGICLVPLGFMAFDAGRYMWDALVPQTISSDCGGTAERVTLTMRGPVIQVTPVVEVLLGLWVLHICALLMSPLRPNAHHHLTGRPIGPQAEPLNLNE